MDGLPCKCAAGYVGIRCGVNITTCSLRQCKNGGNCTNSVSGLPCTCAAGYSGTDCGININECASSPCKNGGKCVDGVNEYACTCLAGYSGLHCEVSFMVLTTFFVMMFILFYRYIRALQPEKGALT